MIVFVKILQRHVACINTLKNYAMLDFYDQWHFSNATV